MGLSGLQADAATRAGRDRWFWTLPVAALLRFVNLGFADLQAWDEALYAVRAEAVLRFGAWIDQTPFAIDGLYSSLHPPLHIWLTALSFLVFGIDEWSARVVAALAGGGTILVLYAIGKELHSERCGIVAGLLFGLNPFVTFYARQGQFDSTLVFFLSLTLLWHLRVAASPTSTNAVWAGFALGAALMSKAYAAWGLPLAFVAYWWSQPRPARPDLRPFFLSLGIAAAVTIPWYLFMQIRHGGSDLLFLVHQSQLLERTVHGIEGNVKPLEVFYFVNQIFVQFSAGAVWLVYGGVLLMSSRRQSRWMYVVWTFVVFFVVFSVVRTKLAVYLLPMLVPASVIAAVALLEFPGRSLNRIQKFVLLSGSGIALLWAASQGWRNLAKDLVLSIGRGEVLSSGLLSALPVPAGVLILTLAIAAAAVRYSSDLRLRSILVPFLLGWWAFGTLVSVVVLDRVQYRDGASELAQFLHDGSFTSVVVAGYERNPQLTFYLDGADIGWRSDLHVRRIVPPADSTGYRRWLERETSGEGPGAVMVFEKDKFVRYRHIDPSRFTPEGWRRIFRSRRYEVYQPPSFPEFVSVVPRRGVSYIERHGTAP